VEHRDAVLGRCDERSAAVIICAQQMDELIRQQSSMT
jgi:hypothetical protein